MTNAYDEYADKAAASYLQGRMDEQGVWVEAVRELRAWYVDQITLAISLGTSPERFSGKTDALDALLRRMGAE